MAVPPKPASTVVPMRGRNNGSSQPEVLPEERSQDSSAGPGAFVFPSGVAEPRDNAQGVRPSSPHLTPELAAAKIADDSPPGKPWFCSWPRFAKPARKRLSYWPGQRAPRGLNPIVYPGRKCSG